MPETRSQCIETDSPESYPHCVVCFKPLGNDQRTFPDGCLAHERCFVDTPWEQIRSHMVAAGQEKS